MRCDLLVYEATYVYFFAKFVTFVIEIVWGIKKEKFFEKLTILENFRKFPLGIFPEISGNFRKFPSDNR